MGTAQEGNILKVVMELVRNSEETPSTDHLIIVKKLLVLTQILCFLLNIAACSISMKTDLVFECLLLFA